MHESTVSDASLPLGQTTMSQMRLSLQCYGTVTLSDGDEPIELPTSKARLMLVYLMFCGQRSVARRTLAELFWPDMTEARGLANLSTLLSMLRRALPEYARELVQSDAQSIGLTDGMLSCDVSDVSALLAQVERHPHRSPAQCPICTAQLTAALQLVRGPFCSGLQLWDHEQLQQWLERMREYHRQQVIALLEPLLTHAVLLRAWPDVIRFSERLLQEDPWHEHGLQQLLRAYALNGRRLQAVQRYERFCVELARELRSEPLPETRAYVDALRRGVVPELPALRCAVPDGERLLGRAVEMRQLIAWLVRSDRRLITVSGLGGVGKTLLAVTAAQQMAPLFRDGTVFVALDGITDAARVMPTIAQACGITLSGPQPVLRQVAEVLAEQEMLLICDNTEQIVGFDAIISELLRRTQHPVLLVTARRPLALWQESVILLHGFIVDDDHAADDDRAAAIALFRDRMERTGLTSDGLAPGEITAICQAVGGLPLAIELAARQLQRTTAPQLLALLQRNNELLFAQASDLPDRQRRIDGIFAQAWQELTSEQRQALADLTVISGVLTPAAVAAVIGPAAAELIHRLAGQGLVMRRRSRDELHPLLRRLVQQRALDVTAARARHADYYLGLLAQAQLTVIDGPSRQRAGELADNYDNLQAAWQWTAQHGDQAQLTSLIESLLVLMLCRGWYAIGAELLEATAGRTAAAAAAQCLIAAARLRLASGDYAVTRQLARRVLRLNDDPASRGEAVFLRAQVLHEEGRYRATARLAQHGLRWASSSALRARLLHTAGRALMWAGDLPAADVLYAQALVAGEASGNLGLVIDCLNDRAQIPARGGDLAGSLPLLEAAAAQTMLHGEVQARITALVNVGAVRAVLQIEPDGAVAMLEQALALARHNGNRRDLVSVLHSVAYGLLHLRRLREAGQLLEEGLQLALQLDHAAFTLELIEGFGLLASHAAQPHLAQHWLSSVAGHERTAAYVQARAQHELRERGLVQLAVDGSLSAAELGRQVLAQARSIIAALP